MDSEDRGPLHDRVDRLERELAEIKELLKQSGPAPARTPSALSSQQQYWTAPPPPLETRPAAQKGFELPEYMRRGEFWLSRVGIGLVLFGLVFAFKYSIDQGWITPPVRHFFGIGIGILLLIFGWRLYAKRLHLSQLLLGGSVAAFYITDYSAFQLFELISHPTAFALMVAVTCLAFFISLRQNDALFSIIGVLGGLGTPFILYTDSGNIPGLVFYTCLILAGTLAVYYFKGWRTLLWLSAIGGWIVMLIGIDAAETLYGQAGEAARLALQLGVLFMWLGFGVFPAVRKYLRRGDKANASLSHDESHIHVLAIGSPLIALGMTAEVWPGGESQTLGWIALAASALYALVSWGIRRLESMKSLAFTGAVTGAILLTLALSLLLDGDTLYLALAAEAAALHLLARRLDNSLVFAGANLLSLVVGVWFLVHLMFPDDQARAIFNGRAACDLIVILFAGLAALTSHSPFARRIYGLAAHLAFLAWLARELHGLDNGQGYLSIAWGVYGAVLLIVALRKNLETLRWTGLGTLMLLVGKLFLVDLSMLETIWRVLLFMGLGATFLLLSYFFPKLWKGKIEP
jgi:uncharacterized membrane protein